MQERAKTSLNRRSLATRHAVGRPWITRRPGSVRRSVARPTIPDSRFPIPGPRSSVPGRSVRRSEIVVDLRPLERTGEVGVTDLRFGVELVHLPPAFAMAVPGLLHAAERKVCLGADRRG